MFSLSQTAGYAIKALSCLASHHPRPMVAKDISACMGIPLPYLSKFIHRLKKNGFIEAKRGHQGGFTLARSASGISLMDVARVLDGPGVLPRCLLGFQACADERACPTHNFWKEERARIEMVLRTTTIAEVAAFDGECCQCPPGGSGFIQPEFRCIPAPDSERSVGHPDILPDNRRKSEWA